MTVTIDGARTRIARLLLAALLAFAATPVRAQALNSSLDAYIQPYVAGQKFSGAVLVARDGEIVFDQAYGYANEARRIPNATSTSFHIASLSKAYTAAVAMHLVEKGSLRLDNTVAQFLPDVKDGGRITIRNLLEDSPDPADEPAPSPKASDAAISQNEPAYGLLARIVELRTGNSYGEALNALVFGPQWMDGAGVDTDDLGDDRRYAVGYVPAEAGGLKPAAPLHWSALAGEGSVYTTTRDELRFVKALFDGSLLKPVTRAEMFDGPNPAGFGWSRRDDPALGGRVYYLAGNAGGFAAFVLHAPATDSTVIVFSNINSRAVATMAEGIAAIALKSR